jgi:outer membrane protein TolC
MIAREQLRAGVGVGLDVTRAQAQLSGLHTQLISARGEQSRLRLELLRAIGAPLDATVALASSLQQIDVDRPIPDEADAMAVALRERADLLTAERALDAGRQDMRATRAERLPTLSAFADDGAIGTRPSNLLNTYTWGVQLSLPVFDGSRRSGKLSEQQAINSGLELQRRELERQVRVEVKSALLALETARDQVRASRERLALAQLEYALAQDRFKAGVAGNADVISAALALNSARGLTIDALASYQGAQIELARAQGIATRLP